MRTSHRPAYDLSSLSSVSDPHQSQHRAASEMQYVSTVSSPAFQKFRARLRPGSGRSVHCSGWHCTTQRPPSWLLQAGTSISNYSSSRFHHDPSHARATASDTAVTVPVCQCASVPVYHCQWHWHWHCTGTASVSALPVADSERSLASSCQCLY